MTSNELSADDRKRAEQIYKRALWIGHGVRFVAFISFCFFRVLDLPSGVAMGVLGGISSNFIQQFAEQQVKNAGLSLERIEKHLIPFTTTPTSEPFVVRPEGAAGLGKSCFLISVVFLAFSAVGQTGPKPSNVYIAGVVFSCALMALSVYMMSRPLVLRLDAQGVRGWSSIFKQRYVNWDQVAVVEVQQSFNCMGKPHFKTVVFLDHENRPLIKVPLTFPVIEPKCADTFVAQIEARLNAE